MRVVSLNVGLPREVLWQDRVITTSIFKTPVRERIWLRKLDFDGDQQADLTVHGGPDRAVYGYPLEHYDYWHRELPDVELPPGAFGENLTTEGLLESEVRIGDLFRLGSAQIIVTQPRLPCYKLQAKFRRADIVKRFAESHRTGFYFRVAQEGNVAAGDTIELVQRQPGNLTMSDIVTLYLSSARDVPMLRRAVELEALPTAWRDYFRRQLEQLRGEHAAAVNESRP
jgi:MOSC domain-containing protein YiiM